LKLVAIPLLTSVAVTHGEKGDGQAELNDGAIESMIAAPKDWCPQSIHNKLFTRSRQFDVAADS